MLYHQLANVGDMQKDSWATIIGILQSEAAPEATLFAAITLRGKV
jgi:transportin-3